VDLASIDWPLNNQQERALNKLVTLISAAIFALGTSSAFAQAPKADAKADAKADVKTDKSAKKADAKAGTKADAKAEAKSDKAAPAK
jgi:hypothetical protein